MWTDVDRFVSKYHMFDQADQVVIGLSGGADSVCLARYLLHLRDHAGPALTAVHVNHLLRGDEADRDEEFVRDFCRRWQISLDVYRRDVREVSIRDKETLEEAGRKVRYACFRETVDRLGKTGRTCLCLAHHGDDLAETMLFRMIRGTGPRGLAAIRPVSGKILRPFLAIRKERILSILEDLGQDYVTDSTNEDLHLSRNHLRHRVFPELEKQNPRAVDHLMTLSGQMTDLLDFAGERINVLCGSLIHESHEGFYVEVQELEPLPVYARQELARRLLFLAGGQEKDIGSIHVKQLLLLAANTEGKRNDFPYGVRAVRMGGRLVVYKAGSGGVAKNCPDDEEKMAHLPLEVLLPGYEDGRKWTLDLSGYGRLLFRYEDIRNQQILKRDCIKYFDYDKIKSNLCIKSPS